MPLTIVKVKNAKPAEKLRKLSDGGGLYLLILPAGGKYWRVKYRVNGKEKVLALGTFPEVSLAEAREGRDSAGKQPRNGVDPVEARKAAKAANAGDPANSFEAVAREWHGKYLHTWSTGHAKPKLQRLETLVFPTLGSRPIGGIKAPDLLPVLRRIEARGALEMARRVRTMCGELSRYAISSAPRAAPTAIRRRTSKGPCRRPWRSILRPSQTRMRSGRFSVLSTATRERRS